MAFRARQKTHQLLRRLVDATGFCLRILEALARAAVQRHIVEFEPADPEFLLKLGMTEDDWRALRQLSTEQMDVTIKSVGKVSADVVQISYHPSNGYLNQGAIKRFEKKSGVWRQQNDFHGLWATSTLQD
jgi:hypothetical protein